MENGTRLTTERFRDGGDSLVSGGVEVDRGGLLGGVDHGIARGLCLMGEGYTLTPILTPGAKWKSMEPSCLFL